MAFIMNSFQQHPGNEQYEAEYALKSFGLVNPGSDLCFANAVLQLLWSAGNIVREVHAHQSAFGLLTKEAATLNPNCLLDSGSFLLELRSWAKADAHHDAHVW